MSHEFMSGTGIEGCPHFHIPFDCHLTDSDTRIIKAMIAGKWGGHTCKYGKQKSEYDEWCCGTEDGPVCVPCLLWTPREGER